MRKKIKVEQLESEVKKILQKYEDDIYTEEIEVMRRVCSAGAAAVRDNAHATITGRYAKGWGYKTENGRLFVRGYIYQQEVPGLAHLLEHGHALPQGGRTAPKPHVAPAQEKIKENFISETIRGISKL